MTDMTTWACEAYILYELEEHSRTVQYFTDNTTIEERAEITQALENLLKEREIIRVGNIFKIRGC